MTDIVSPIGYAVPYVGIDSNGRPVKIHPNFIRWWEMALSVRVGGSSALSNLELQQLIDQLAASEQFFQPYQGDMLASDILQPITMDNSNYETVQMDGCGCLLETTFQE